MNPQHRPRIVDSTLREGEQFARAHFDSDERVAIARALDAFGVDVIEMTSPAASPRSAADLRRVAQMGLGARVVAHTRCHPEDVRLALDCGVDGVHLLFGTSHLLRTHGHGRGLERIRREAGESIRAVTEGGVEARFSCEDAFRTPLGDLVELARAAEAMGAQRIGLADTVGVATPEEVTRVVGVLRSVVDCDIEFHGHNDSGCAVANAFAAFRAGATHLDTTVLGIGERNGIASLSGLVARLFVSDPSWVEGLCLERLGDLDELVAGLLGLEVPFNACITSPEAFTHKAGLHTKAVLAEPSTYEAIAPERFGRTRRVLSGHHLTGRHVLAQRARELGLELEPEALIGATRRVKQLADDGPLGSAQVDALLLEATRPVGGVS